MKISIIKRKIKLVFQTFEYLLKIILFSNFKSKRQLLNISKRKQNTKIRILGNGNSLKQGGFIDRAYDYMVLNDYFLSESYYEVKPLYI